MENTTPDIQVGYTLKWKLLLGFAISTFVIIVIALVTIGVITNGSFVFENSQSPTLAPTKAPTLAPITSPPTMAPITSQPTMTPITSPPTMTPITSPPTMTPITSPPTFAPTPSPTMAPITTLYTRYQSECYVPKINAGIDNIITAALVRAVGGYEPPGSSNNYIFENAYGGPYIPNVQDPENASGTQAPGRDVDSYLYVKLELYNNIDVYNQFLTAAYTLMNELGKDTAMIIQNFKSLTPVAESIYGKGYSLIQFFTLSSIDFNDLTLVQLDPSAEIDFKDITILQSSPTNTETVLCTTKSPTFAPTPSPTSSPTAAPTSTPINVCSSPYNLPGPYSGSTVEMKWADNDYFVSLEANVFMKPSLSTQETTGSANIMRFSNEFAINPPYSSISIYCSNYLLRCQYVDNLNNYHNLSNTLNILPNNEYNVLFYLDSNRILLKVTNVLTSESITNQIYEPTGFTSTNDISKQNKLDIGVEDAASSKVIVSNIKLCGAVPTLAPTTAAPTPTLAPTQSTKIGIYSGCYDIAYLYWKTNKWSGSTNDWGECNGVFPQGESYNYYTQDAFFAKYSSDPSITRIT